MTATFNILRSHFKFCSQFWKLQSRDCRFWNVNFQHFAVTFRIMTATFNILQSHFEFDEFWFRIMTATFNILQSHFELWLQLLTFCGHISNYDGKMLKFAVTFLILQSEMDFWNWWRGIRWYSLYVQVVQRRVVRCR